MLQQWISAMIEHKGNVEVRGSRVGNGTDIDEFIFEVESLLSTPPLADAPTQALFVIQSEALFSFEDPPELNALVDRCAKVWPYLIPC